jgi:hypothetical protein
MITFNDNKINNDLTFYIQKCFFMNVNLIEYALCLILLI